MVSERETAVRAAMEVASRSGPNGWHVAPCPFCASQHKNSKRRCFGILMNMGIYRCFRCGIRGRLGGFEDAAPQAPRKPREESFKPPEGYYPLTGDRSISLAPAREYVNSRGIPPNIVESMKLGACAVGWYRGRVVAPVLDTDQTTWLGFSARSWLPRGEVESPYLNPGGMLKGQIMYNVSALYDESQEFVIVTEGVFDTLVLLAGLNASAFLGKPSPFQEDLLAECPLPVVTLLDGDAWTESQALAWKLQMRGKRAAFLRLPPGEDPGSLGLDWVEKEVYRVL